MNTSTLREAPVAPARSTSTPRTETGARLLRCVGDRPTATVDVRDARPAVPRHVAAGRPLDPTTPVPLPDPTALSCAVVRAAVEVIRGERTVQQLARWVTPEIYDALARRTRIVLSADTSSADLARPVTVRRARVMRLGPGAAEATVIVEDGDRVRAAAARLEARRGAWRVVALEIG